MRLFRRSLAQIITVSLFFLLITIDVVTSRSASLGADPNLDSLMTESGNPDVDGYTAASVATHVAIVRSDYQGLSFSKSDTAALSNAEVREMVHKAITLDRHWLTTTPELKYLIQQKGANCRVTVMPNLNAVPGERYMPGDGTDPRIIWAVIDYLADSTPAARISLLAGGSYAPNHVAETDIFNLTEFTNKYGTVNRWNSQYPDLPDDFSLKKITDAAQARNPGKIVECINTNYNEIMAGGLPYNEMNPATRDAALPEYYTVPQNGPFGIGPLSTANTEADNGKYNPTDAVKNCDIFVNLPAMKTTGQVVVNNLFKNYIGSMSRGVYGYSLAGDYPRDRSRSLNSLDHGYTDKTVVNQFSFKPTDYCISDATSSLEGPGSHPWSNRTGWLRRNFILAGHDPVAVEAVAAASMNFHPNDIDMLRWAAAKGYGIMDLRQIGIFGTPLEAVRTDFMAPMGEGAYNFPGFRDYHYLDRTCRRWLLNGPYTAADNKTEHIAETAADPRPGDSANGLPWVKRTLASNTADLVQLVPGTTTNSVVYAFTQLFSEWPYQGLIYAGGVRDMRIWVNGELLADTANILTFSNINIVKPVTLKRGDNRILVKVRRSGTSFRFSLAVVNDGALSPRNTYAPHGAQGLSVAAPRDMIFDMKRSLFGGRGLPGTFYHLGQSDPIAVELATLPAGSALSLSQNLPNPFTASTRIAFRVPSDRSVVSLTIHDAAGRTVRTLQSGSLSRGAFVHEWNGRNDRGRMLSAGVYFCRLSSGHETLTRRMVFLR